MEGAFVPWTDRYSRGTRDLCGYLIDGSGCHIWLGSRTNRGYGQAFHDGRHHLVHRLRYKQDVGPIPDGFELDHYVCDNGAGGCCNPYHVRPVTHRENVLRANTVAAIAAAKSHCPRGHPYSADNLVQSDLRIGKRKCRTCNNARVRARSRSLAKEGGK